MKLFLTLLVMTTATACGYKACPPHSHQLTPDTCECDTCFNDADAGACLSEPEPGCGSATR
jgi:hypothetical protein